MLSCLPTYHSPRLPCSSPRSRPITNLLTSLPITQPWVLVFFINSQLGIVGMGIALVPTSPVLSQNSPFSTIPTPATHTHTHTPCTHTHTPCTHTHTPCTRTLHTRTHPAHTHTHPAHTHTPGTHPARTHAHTHTHTHTHTPVPATPETPDLRISESNDCHSVGLQLIPSS
jgi:hypothetical protein